MLGCAPCNIIASEQERVGWKWADKAVRRSSILYTCYVGMRRMQSVLIKRHLIARGAPPPPARAQKVRQRKRVRGGVSWRQSGRRLPRSHPSRSICVCAAKKRHLCIARQQNITFWAAATILKYTQHERAAARRLYLCVYIMCAT